MEISGQEPICGKSCRKCFWREDFQDFKLPNNLVFWFWGILGSALRAEFPVSTSNHAGLMPRLPYSSTHRSSECFMPLKNGWAQDAWRQWSYKNWYFHRDISHWPSLLFFRLTIWPFLAKLRWLWVIWGFFLSFTVSIGHGQWLLSSMNNISHLITEVKQLEFNHFLVHLDRNFWGVWSAALEQSMGGMLKVY